MATLKQEEGSCEVYAAAPVKREVGEEESGERCVAAPVKREEESGERCMVAPVKREEESGERCVVAPVKREEESGESYEAAPANELQEENFSPTMTEFLQLSSSLALFTFTFPFSVCVCLRKIRSYEKAVVIRFGQLLEGASLRDPGMTLILPCIDKLVRVDMRTLSLDVEPQHILTTDSVPITVDTVVNYLVKDPTKYVIRNGEQSTHLLAEQILRDVLGAKTMSTIWKEQEHINATVQRILNEATDQWGIFVDSVEIKNINLPDELQRAMNEEAKATSEAKAEVNATNGIAVYTPPSLS